MKQGAETMQTFHTDDMSEGERMMHTIMMVLIYGGSTALVLALLYGLYRAIR